ncbi:LOW QUALITY PROTEIN: RNA-binding protein 34-like [Pocillopora damicornis]|uniref:LOW QUALITY PROTEIN: RNA-binding protein 34-like n=1 Tax=Pocillopora damicornis TaxID=46731 RepID=UPI000F5576B6|nr:LOW QUALITY PROTEIN: RNA-binding protein 34-like [Pocillopora damicornis]
MAVTSANCSALVGYKVGEISKALHSRTESKTRAGDKLNSLFSSAKVIQPEFEAIGPKTCRTPSRDAQNFKRNFTDCEEIGDLHQDFTSHSRKRKEVLSDDEDMVVKNPSKKCKKSCEAVENPERVARTVFVGNLPVTLSRKKLKQMFAIYGEVESVRFRSAALAKPGLSRKVAMKKREFHSDRHNINAYVVFKERKSALKSLSSNGLEVGGFHIRVDITGKDIEHDHTRSIFVGNLPFDTEEEPLRQAFSEFGEIEGVRIVRDSKTGAGKGFGFILFKERDGVMFALRRHKIEFQGRQLRIFPSTENPHLGQLKSVKKGKPVAYAFSGITSKKSTRYDCRGKKCNRGPAKVMQTTRNKA